VTRLRKKKNESNTSYRASRIILIKRDLGEVNIIYYLPVAENILDALLLLFSLRALDDIYNMIYCVISLRTTGAGTPVRRYERG